MKQELIIPIFRDPFLRRPFISNGFGLRESRLKGTKTPQENLKG